MKAKNSFKRTAKSIDGAETAKAPRTHAEMPADDRAKARNPQRMDILRRHAISNRNKDQ